MSEQKSSPIEYKSLTQLSDSIGDDDDQGDSSTTSSTTTTRGLLVALPLNLRRSYFCTSVTAFVVLLFTIGCSLFFIQVKTSSAAKSPTLTQDSSRLYDNNKIYGHVHVAKSGGTSLIYQLAYSYNKVCSNKSNSKDIVTKNLDKYHTNSSASKHGPNSWAAQFNKVLDQCDYISNEFGVDFWLDTQWSKPLELHVPCKDPIELLMSNCYFPAERHPGFKCSPGHVTEEALGHQIDKCLNHGKRLRFETRLYEEAPSHNITLKCFNYKEEFTDYIKYMDERLEHNPRKEGLVAVKDGKLVDYPKPRSKTLRNISSECIWKDWDLKQRVKGYLLDHYFYFRYCAECLNSSDDLFAEDSNVKH